MASPRITVAMALGASLMVCTGCTGADDDSTVGLDCDRANEIHPSHVIIESEDDLAQLDGLRAIQGELQVDKTTFTDLDFLGCIEQVGNSLTIFGNDALTNVDGLAALQRVGGTFAFSENDAVTDLDGVRDLTEVSGNVIIQNNATMTGISGLSSLATIGSAINIRSNPVLEHIDGLRGLRSVGGQLAITQNPSLCLSSVNVVGEGITSPSTIPDNWSTRANNDDC
ncbi:MAG: hypothetical protein AAGF11_13325 [Myxococcota bacterium]